MKNKRIYFILFALNISVVLRLIYQNVNIRYQMIVFDISSIPGYFLGNSEIPTIGNVAVSSFSLNWFIIIMYLLITGAVVYLLLNYNDIIKRNLYIISGVSAVMLLVIFLLNLTMGLLVLLLLLTNVAVLYLVRLYDGEGKKLVTVISFVVFALVVIGVDRLISHYSTYGREFIDILDHAMFTKDMLFIQSTLNFYLIDSILGEITYVLWIGLVAIGLYFLAQLFIKFSPNGENFDDRSFINFFYGIFMYLKPLILLFMVIFLSTKYTEYGRYSYRFQEDGNINSGYCFTDEYRSREMGSNIMDGDFYTYTCFDTTQGTMTVKVEVTEKNRDGMFDLILNEAEISRYVLFNDKNEEVLSFDASNGEVYQITMTTKEEAEEGFQEIITVKEVKQYGYDEYTIYDLDGNEIIELPLGRPERMQLRVVAIYTDGFKILVKDPEIEYVVITEDLDFETKYYKFDGTIVTE